MDKTITNDDEILEGMGLEEEKEGQATVMEVMKRDEKEKLKEEATVLEQLKDAKKHISTYNGLLANLLRNWLQMIEWPTGWEYNVEPDEVGVVLIMSYKKRLFQAAFKPTGLEKYDKAAVEAFVTRAENTVQKVMNGPEQTNL